MHLKPVLWVFAFSMCAWISASGQPRPGQEDLTQYINPLVGTDSEFKLSNGNTYPAIALPWGMNFWTPQTGKMGDGWGYTYDAYKIRGFKQTHQPSPWINDYAAFALMPVTGKLRFKEDERASWFSHKRETAKPHYYQVYLADHDVWTEITPTARAAFFRFTFPRTDSAFILVDGFFQGSEITIDPARRRITGYCQNNHGGVPANFRNYFVAYFDKPFTATHTWKDSLLMRHSLQSQGNHAGGILQFATQAGEKIHVRVASSFISLEQAERNLQQEIGKAPFDEIKSRGQAAWNKELQRIRVEGGTVAQKTTFYTALYRLLLFPRPLHEVNARGEIVHYSPYNGKVLPGYLYTDNGFWDTFRAVFPFFNVMYRERNSQIMQGLVNTYKESGWLPEWASPGHRDCMIGSNSASLIADAFLKGIRGFDIQTLYEAILKNTENEGPMSSVGRYGVEYYNRLGYIPYNVGIRENTARTLEYSYDDFCIYQLSKALGRPQEEQDRFARRARFYQNVFDPQTRFMRGKNADGSWQSPFRPDKWGDAFTEGSAWHYTWSVFHDPLGLITLMGGDAAFIAKLDSVFLAPPTFDDSYYGFPIHEITEMVIAGMGQYAHGNQPVQHAAYLFNYAGAPWKTQQRVREIMDLLYTPNPDGLCGDEDNGQTSAWYVFSAMGFYPVCPGVNEYALGSPLFKKITLTLENGKTYTIEAPSNGPNTPYIQKAEWNGAPYSRNFLRFEDLLAGGKLVLTMGDQPNTQRGVGKGDRPFSMSKGE